MDNHYVIASTIMVDEYSGNRDGGGSDPAPVSLTKLGEGGMYDQSVLQMIILVDGCTQFALLHNAVLDDVKVGGGVTRARDESSKSKQR